MRFYKFLLLALIIHTALCSRSASHHSKHKMHKMINIYDCKTLPKLRSSYDAIILHDESCIISDYIHDLKRLHISKVFSTSFTGTSHHDNIDFIQRHSPRDSSNEINPYSQEHQVTESILEKLLASPDGSIVQYCSCHIELMGNGACDPECNVPECSNDGGDCDEPK